MPNEGDGLNLVVRTLLHPYVYQQGLKDRRQERLEVFLMCQLNSEKKHVASVARRVDHVGDRSSRYRQASASHSRSGAG